MGFAYFIVFPIAFGFFAGYAPVGVQMMTDIDKYLSFVLTMFIAFGLEGIGLVGGVPGLDLGDPELVAPLLGLDLGRRAIDLSGDGLDGVGADESIPIGV